VIENSNLPFFGSHLIEKSPCISVEQVNILEVAAVHGHNSWFCYFYMILFIPMLLPHLWFGPFTNIVTRVTLLSLNITAKTFTEWNFVAYCCEKTSQILSSWKSSVWNCL